MDLQPPPGAPREAQTDPTGPGDREDVGPARSVGALVALAGAGLVIAGSALPWVRATLGEGLVASVSGIEGGDGWISMALGVFLAALAIRNRLDPDAGTTGILIVTAVLALLTAYEVIDIVGAPELAGAPTVTVGYGLWLMAAGVVVSVLGVIRMKAA